MSNNIYYKFPKKLKVQFKISRGQKISFLTCPWVKISLKKFYKVKSFAFTSIINIYRPRFSARSHGKTEKDTD